MNSLFNRARIAYRTLVAHALYCRKAQLSGLLDIPIGTEIKIKGGKLYLGRGVSCQKRVTLSVQGGVLKIGEHASFNRNCIIVCRRDITIGDYCQFGPNVCIYDHDHVFGVNGIDRDHYKTSNISIGAGCWIGANVTILRGAEIGANCVIGAGSIITGKIPSNSLVKPERRVTIESLH